MSAPVTRRQLIRSTPQQVSDAVSDYVLAQHCPDADEIDCAVEFTLPQRGATVRVLAERKAPVVKAKRARRAKT